MIARVRLSSNKTTRCRACRLPLIVRLYETRNDHLPEPVRRSDASSGFVHQTIAQVVCPVCEGVESYACTGCGGRGEVAVKRERDPYSVDHVPAAGTATVKLGHEPSRDAELLRLAGQTMAPFANDEDEIDEADKDGNDYGWREARKTMYARYSYAELDAAVEQLRQIDLEAFMALEMLYGQQRLAPVSLEAKALARVNAEGMTQEV